MLFFFIATLLQASDTLTGRVVDVGGQPVAAAIVEVTELGRSVTTTEAGEFRVAIAPGRYTLAVRRHGFAPVVREIVVARGQATLEIVLTPSALRLEPVTVTASRQPSAVQTSPLPASALSGDALRQAQGVSLAHVVEALPGVRTLSTGAQIGKPMIRGFSGPRVLVLENGSRLEDYSWSDEDGPSVETAFARRIELIRGPASVLYGSDALGGVINVIPEELPDAAGGPGFTRIGFTLSAASNNIEIAPGAQVEGARGNLGWRVAAIGRHASNLHTPAGELDNTGFGAFNGEAAAGWRWPSGSSLEARVIHYGGDFKLLEANAPPGETGGPERKAGDERVQITGQRPWGTWRVEGKGQLQFHSLIEVADDSTGTESEQFNLLLQTGSLDLLLHRGGTTRGIAMLGQRSDASGREPIVPNANVLSSAAFAFEQWSPGSGRWTGLAGLRGDFRRLSAERDDSLGVVAQERSNQAWSGNAGVVFTPVPGGGLSLSLNVGRAWRAPTLFELFANGPHIGEARFERGDSTLKPEHSLDVDVGLRWSGRRARFELAAYGNSISNFTYIIPTGAFIDSLRVYQYAQAKAEMRGAEAVIETDLGRGLIARGRLEAVRGTNRTSAEPLPLMPPLRAALGLTWRDRLRVDVDAYARQDRPNPLDIPTPGYALLHVGGGADVRRHRTAQRAQPALSQLPEPLQGVCVRPRTEPDRPPVERIPGLARHSRGAGRVCEDGPDPVDPFAVLRLHQHGAQADDRARVALHLLHVDQMQRQCDEREVQVALRRFREDAARQVGGVADAFRARRPDDDVELRRRAGNEPTVTPQPLVELERGRAPSREPLCELSVPHQRQQALRRPERDRGRARPGALERDLAEVHFSRGVVRIRRVVIVQTSHGGITEQHAAAPVRLQSVLVGIDHHGRRFTDSFERLSRLRLEAGDEQEIPTVRRVGVNPEIMRVAQRDDIREGIDGARGRRPHRGDHGAHVPRGEPPRQGGHIDATA